MTTLSEKLVQCQGCHGSGGEIEVVLEDGSGPFEPCGYCRGTGRTTRVMNMWIARWRKNPRQAPSEEALARHETIMDRLLERTQRS